MLYIYMTYDLYNDYRKFKFYIYTHVQVDTEII